MTEARRKIDPGEVRLFSGRSNQELAKGIALHLGVPLDPTHLTNFGNDNMEIQLGASVRGRSVYIVQSLTTPVSEPLLELLMMLDIAGFACSSGSACKTGSPKPSEVLLACGLSADWALGSLRITMGKDTEPETIEALLEALPVQVKRQRHAQPVAKLS